ncbi:hypothetical protein EHI8A_187270 [Entamoeba histolytica HM-1:IMSS-B]|uniref:MIF4G-like type 2 domain-containing protein n=6 Tax=Entamoeba histolytica TaxID=5759 RepID=B1N4Y9_ENTH1|nr:hypothetical protein EHI_102800 [Entamoeba histolytica HM-1:IMSS]EMD46576.1 Hypothetical protein EHI5A_207590 [Entamoeba histolytica KU27]EMH78015.1 hypothetical protein EHI8A_187270 [Entamoeba histolytica HM-1:IMSS-B]EMS12871.1 hypothetical protein KM1_257860 [Entamoeba histolytica HM-3:IMSS]ENY65248.1 hypothetical protein EHI7A_164340 [Entamoeba histolytica HM-1:IMSS-A]GAT99035.1 hypothetical protein CL6EHI_102800 [Entamoeba histolytica]|eukprot:XP_001914255.1 hypothetical protein EHI_102800 [Entamoeba histolytica HM-1:IMSS]
MSPINYTIKNIQQGVIIESNEIPSSIILNNLYNYWKFNKTQCIFIIDYLMKERILSCFNYIFNDSKSYSFHYIDIRDSLKTINIPLFSEPLQQKFCILPMLIQIHITLTIINNQTESISFISFDSSINCIISSNLICNVPLILYSGETHNYSFNRLQSFTIANNWLFSCNSNSLVNGKIIAQFGTISLSLEDIQFLERITKQLIQIKELISIELKQPEREVYLVDLSISIPTSKLFILHQSQCLHFIKLTFTNESII